MTDERDDLPAELAAIASAIRAAGPALAPSAELDARVRAIPRAAAPAQEAGVADLGARRSRAAAWRAATVALASVAAVLGVLLLTRGPDAPGARELGRVAFTANADAGVTSSGSAVLEETDAGDRRVRLELRGLAPSSDGFYQLWISQDPDHRIAIGAFRPDADGKVSAVLELPDLDATWKALWLTREPDDGDPAWTDDWIVKGSIA